MLSHRKTRSFNLEPKTIHQFNKLLLDVDEERGLRPIRSAFVCQLLDARMIDDGLSHPDKADTVIGLDMILSYTYAVKIGDNHGFTRESTFNRSAECA